MQRIVAVVLVVLLVAPPASARQKPNAPIDWQRIQRLNAGTQITFTATGQPLMLARLLFADDAILVTLKPSDPKLADRVEHMLLQMDVRWHAIFDRGESVVDNQERPRVRVSPEGIFDGARKVADLADLINQTPRSNVLAISEAPHTHRVRYLLIGVAIAAAVGVCIALVASSRGGD